MGFSDGSHVFPHELNLLHIRNMNLESHASMANDQDPHGSLLSQAQSGGALSRAVMPRVQQKIMALTTKTALRSSTSSDLKNLKSNTKNSKHPKTTKTAAKGRPQLGEEAPEAKDLKHRQKEQQEPTVLCNT